MSNDDDTILPPEVLIKIFSFLDFKTTQKTCTLVCLRWKEIIRSDQKLSGDLKLLSWNPGRTKLSASEANAILSNWKKLQTLRISQDLKDNPEINFKNHPNLKKIIVANHQSSINDNCGKIFDVMELKELPAWADVTNIWFDPKNPQNPPKNASFDSVVELRIVLDDENHVFDPSLEHIGPKMNNLETVFLSFESEARTNDFRYTYPLLQGLQKCPNLSDLIVSFNEGYGARKLYSFMKQFSKRFPKIIRLEIFKENESEIYLCDLSWIPRLRNLQKLVIKEVVLEGGKDTFEAFIKNPMSSLTHFEIGGYAFAFYSDTFLMKLTKIFPRIETFIIDNNDIDEPQGGWNGITLLGVLHALSQVKNLDIGLCMNLDRDFVTNTEHQVEELFQFALEIIEEKFPCETTDIKLVEFEHCFTMVKERGKPGKIFQDKPEDHDTGLSIYRIIEHYPNNDGAVLCLVNQEQIHLTVDTIHQIIEVATKNDE